MTWDEARAVAYVCAQADNQCVNCVSDLFEILAEKLPEVDWMAALRECDPEMATNVEGVLA